ncbi:MAG: metallophosphoesterase family protein [Planctomycetota bacterium]
MRTLAIGDIHGCFTAFRTLLDAVRPTADDVLVTLGDYIDRGPDSRGVIEMLLALGDRCQLVSLLGNHEQMMMDARQSSEHFGYWMMCGGRPAIDSYSPTSETSGRMADVPDSHWQFLDATCKEWHETDDHIFVHAGLYHDVPMSEQPAHMLRWEKLDPYDPYSHESGKLVICGHTVQKGGVPLHLGSVVCIDTWAYGGGWLTCMDVASGQYWQSNERGESRTGVVNAP